MGNCASGRSDSVPCRCFGGPKWQGQPWWLPLFPPSGTTYTGTLSAGLAQLNANGLEAYSYASSETDYGDGELLADWEVIIIGGGIVGASAAFSPGRARAQGSPAGARRDRVRGLGRQCRRHRRAGMGARMPNLESLPDHGQPRDFFGLFSWNLATISSFAPPGRCRRFKPPDNTSTRGNTYWR